jgi:hypothetical protein
MRYFSIDRSLRGACAFVILAGAAAFAEPTTGSNANPETNASDKNFDENQPNTIGGGLQKTEDAGNRALNKVDRGVHKGVNKTKRGGKKAKKKSNDALESVDESIHTKKAPETAQ